MAETDSTPPALDGEDLALAERLVAAGRVTQAQLDACLALRPATPGRLLDLLVARGLVDAREIGETDVTPHRAGPGTTAPTPGSSSTESRRTPARIAQYEVLGELGRGGVGVVYRARDAALNREVAIKTLHGHRASDEALARFRREASATAQLRHPGIVAVHEVGEHEGDMFVVLELVDGEPLEEVLRREPMTPRRVAELGRSLALALEHVHERGIVHRDVKPNNVLIEPDGNPRLVDFGLARIPEDTTQLTRPGDVLGTPAYMAPEQALGLKDVDARSDVYGLGALLYAMLVGREPFPGTGVAEVIQRVCHDELTPPRRLRPEVPAAVDAAVVRAMAKDPAQRFVCAGDFAQALRRPRGARAKVTTAPSSRAVLLVGALGAAVVVSMTIAVGAWFAAPETSTDEATSIAAPTTAPPRAPTRA